MFSLIFFQNRNNAQSSCAGLFINAHLGFEYPGTWLHIDMAAPAYTVNLGDFTILIIFS